MTNTWNFKGLESVALFVKDLPKGVNSVLIQTIKPKLRGAFYAVCVTGDLDGIFLPGGFDEPPTTLRILHSEDSIHR